MSTDIPDPIAAPHAASPHRVVTPALMAHLRRKFLLNWSGIHGAPHWARVRNNGLSLSRETGANIRVVELFAFVHDLCRHDEGRDPKHGLRAARLVRSLPADVLPLNPEEIELLAEACAGHSLGKTTGDVTVLTCWDADRLDLTRLRIRPDPDRMGTEAGRARAMDLWFGDWTR